jgi:hypothetical protein
MGGLKAKKPSEVKQGKVKGLIFGSSGVGKTWFSLCFPAPYYIDTEGGADLSHYQKRLSESNGSYLGTEDGSLDFNVLIDQIKALATEKHQYKTLVIDSVTKIYQTCIANTAEKLGEKDVFGASKKPAIAQMRRLVNWITRLDMNVWFIAHEITEWGIIDGQRSEIGKIPDVWDKLVYELDLGLQVVRRGKSFPAVGIVHKSRLDTFRLGEQFNLEYSDFAKKYGEDSITGDITSIVLATQDQVSQIIEMVSIRADAEDIKEKLLIKAGADSWSELTTEQAQKTIEWLKTMKKK